MQRSKTCFRCMGIVTPKKERVVRVLDEDKGELLSEVIFHKECWREFILQKRKADKLQNEAFGMLNKVKEMLH